MSSVVILILPIEPANLEKVLLENPEQMIKFKVYKREEIEEIDADVDRRLNRVKNQNKLPLGVWASWVVESILTTGCT